MKTLTEQHTLLQKERQVFDVPVRVYVGCPMLTSRAWLDQAQSYKASDLERQKKAMENSLNNKISQAPAPVSCSAFTANVWDLSKFHSAARRRSCSRKWTRCRTSLGIRSAHGSAYVYPAVKLH